MLHLVPELSLNPMEDAQTCTLEPIITFAQMVNKDFPFETK